MRVFCEECWFPSCFFPLVFLFLGLGVCSFASEFAFFAATHLHIRALSTRGYTIDCSVSLLPGERLMDPHCPLFLFVRSVAPSSNFQYLDITLLFLLLLLLAHFLRLVSWHSKLHKGRYLQWRI